MVLANLPDPPEHPSSLLLRHQQRQALQPAPFEPNISLLREEGSILITNLPDPPEHPSSLSLLLPPDDTNKLQWLPPIRQQAAAYKEIPTGHRFTELPDPPEQPSSLSPPSTIPEQDVVVKDIVLRATIDKKHHSAIGDEPGRYLPASSKSAFANAPPTSSSLNNIGLHCVHVAHEEGSSTTASQPRCYKLIDPPDPPEHQPTQEKQFENRASLVICATVPSTGAHDVQELPMENPIPPLIEALPTAHASAQRQLIQPNRHSEATENQEVQQHVMNTPHQQLLLKEGLTYHHYPLLLEAPAPGQSTSSNHLAGMSDSSLLFHQSIQNPDAMQEDHPTEHQNMQNHTVLSLRESHSRMEGTTFPPPSAQLHMEVQPLKSVQPPESELQATNNKLQPSDGIPFPSYPLPMHYQNATQADHPTTDIEHSNMQHESLSTLRESNLYQKKGSVLSSTSLQQSIKITSIQQSIEILPPKSVRPESELLQETKNKLQPFKDDSLPSLPIEPWLLEGEQDLESHLVLAPLQTHHHHQLQSSTQQAFAPRHETTQMLQLPLLAETTPAQDDEISTSARSLSLFSSISSAISYDSLFSDLLDARIQSATDTLVDLTREADAAMSKLDATTALSVENATASYATLVFEEITTSVGVSSANVYPHSPYASVRSMEKESVNNSKVQPSEKRWNEVVALGADVGVDVEKFHPHGLILKRKACDINLDGDTDHDHGPASIRSSLREYDLLMNRKGNKSPGNMMKNRKFSKVVVNGVCGKMARG